MSLLTRPPSLAAASTWALLAAEGAGRPHTPFDPSTLDHLPAPAARFLRATLPPGTPLSTAVEVEMLGEIRLGTRWFPFTAEEILCAGVGFVWRPAVGGRVLRFEGVDVLGPDEARMEFRIHGRIPVVRATGPDVARSAVGRLAAETVAWAPQALTPQAGARWTAVHDHRANVTLDVRGEPVEVEVTIDDDGHLVSMCLQRWKDSAEPPGYVAFGGAVTWQFVTEGDVRLAGAGTVGWDRGTPEQAAGEFFRYTITSARPVGIAAGVN